MDRKNLKSILQDALEDQIPASQVNLMPAVQADLVARNKPIFQQGKTMNKLRNRKLAFSALAIVALFTVALVTPQGRALAQSVVQFFNRSKSDVLPLPADQIVPPEDAQAMPTAAAPAPFVSVAEAEKSAGFDIKELTSVPNGFNFLGVMALEGSVSIQYEASGGGGTLVINESTDGFMQSEWDQAPAEAISQVRIGNLDAEMVQGGYVVYAGEEVARWNPDAPILRLRWIQDGIWFEMAKFGGVESIAYLDQAGLIALAESMR
jgi:hypothetical protein